MSTYGLCKLSIGVLRYASFMIATLYFSSKNFIKSITNGYSSILIEGWGK